MSIPINEQETVIQISRDSKTASIWTSDTTVMTRLDKLYYCIKEDICQGEVVSKHYNAAKNCISYRTDKAQNPEYTPKRTTNPATIAAALAARAKRRGQTG